MNGQFILIIMVALGGALGALLRFAVSTAFPNDGGIGINVLIVNVIGCFAITFILFSFEPGDNAYAFLLIGVLGAFTTMSAVSLDTVNLFISGTFGTAFLNIVLNVAACVGGGSAGWFLSLH
ncbi:MAG: CrcB family protein [Methanomassiliicoccaceae archaeon]|nr:CrcB family protein [Methanomassiliicoccaceae archaeon]